MLRLLLPQRLLQKQAVLELKLCHAVRSAMGAGQVDKATRIIQQIDAGIMKVDVLPVHPLHSEAVTFHHSLIMHTFHRILSSR